MANADEVNLSNLLTNTKFTADTRLNYISKELQKINNDIIYYNRFLYYNLNKKKIHENSI